MEKTMSYSNSNLAELRDRVIKLTIACQRG